MSHFQRTSNSNIQCSLAFKDFLDRFVWFLLFFIEESEMNSNLFSKLEKSTNDKFPKCVKTILQAAGFNTINSLRSIDEETVKDIEKYIDENRDVLKNIDCCGKNQYLKTSKFVFLPGHKAFLINISKKIDEINNINNKCEKSNTKSSKNPLSQPEPKSEDILKAQLISNLVKYLIKIDPDTPENIITECNILEFDQKQNSLEPRCKFANVVCVGKKHNSF